MYSISNEEGIAAFTSLQFLRISFLNHFSTAHHQVVGCLTYFMHSGQFFSGEILLMAELLLHNSSLRDFVQSQGIREVAANIPPSGILKAPCPSPSIRRAGVPIGSCNCWGGLCSCQVSAKILQVNGQIAAWGCQGLELSMQGQLPPAQRWKRTSVEAFSLPGGTASTQWSHRLIGCQPWLSYQEDCDNWVIIILIPAKETGGFK